MSGIIERDIPKDELYGEESWISSEPIDPCAGLLPSFRSYSSLESLSCDGIDEEERRLCKLNNAIKKLADVIDDPILRENTEYVCCLIRKFLKYNGMEAYYMNHLPQVGAVLEFLATRCERSPEYEEYLQRLLDLCRLAPLLHSSLEALGGGSRLRQHFSLLGYLLVLAPSRCAFLATQRAILELIQPSQRRRRDALKPDACLLAAEASRLPRTLTELAATASALTYPHLLQIALALASASQLCCHRMLEAGMENYLLLRMHPAYGCGFECPPVTDDADLQLESEDHYESVGCATNVLWRLLTSVVLVEESIESLPIFTPPDRAAMWSLRAALRRELVRSRVSSRSRKLRNELASLVLASLMAGARWQLVDSGLAEELGSLVASPQTNPCLDSCPDDQLLETRGPYALPFKKTLLLILAISAQAQPGVCEVFRNKRIISSIVDLVDPCESLEEMPWNDEQLWHLFKYATNALTYLAPKIPDEFIASDGSQRLLLSLKRLMQVEFDDLLITCLVEMICSLSSSNCEPLLRDFDKYDFVPTLLKLIGRILDFEAMTMVYQKTVALALVACENMRENQCCLRECYCDSALETIVSLLARCLSPKPEDSQLEQSFFAAVGTFIWKFTTSCSFALKYLVARGGVYMLLDIIDSTSLVVQNLYLSVLTDICDTEDCSVYLSTWRRSDKKSGVMELLASIWRNEERLFGVRRTTEGCIADIEAPILNDEQWLYLYFTKSVRNLGTVATTAIGPVRPKLHYLYKLIMRDLDKFQRHCRDFCLENISTEDQITLLAVDAYEDLKADEASREVSRSCDLGWLSERLGQPLGEAGQKPGAKWACRVLDGQRELLRGRQLEELRAELETYQAIKHSKLSPAFDALSDLCYLARTSDQRYKLAKCDKLKEVSRATADPPTTVRTLQPTLNVTAVFNQHLRIQSINKSCADLSRGDTTCGCSSSSGRSSMVEFTCSSSTLRSDSSFLFKKYRFDVEGNLL